MYTITIRTKILNSFLKLFGAKSLKYYSIEPDRIFGAVIFEPGIEDEEQDF
jgi:hypothetical protein